jgi:tRNA threonylcarbamoyladenosine biosynthesis protein TsaE
MQFHVSLKDLDAFAKKFWESVGDAKVFAFHGEMGAGKTTIINALCHYKGVEDVTGSPTFSIINEYSFERNGKQNKIYHIDLYRLKDEEEIVQAGVEDCIYSAAFCLVEWPEKAPWLFEENAVHVFVRMLSPTQREVRIELPSTRSLK